MNATLFCRQCEPFIIQVYSNVCKLLTRFLQNVLVILGSCASLFVFRHTITISADYWTFKVWTVTDRRISKMTRFKKLLTNTGLNMDKMVLWVNGKSEANRAVPSKATDFCLSTYISPHLTSLELMNQNNLSENFIVFVNFLWHTQPIKKLLFFVLAPPTWVLISSSL